MNCTCIRYLYSNVSIFMCVIFKLRDNKRISFKICLMESSVCYQIYDSDERPQLGTSGRATGGYVSRNIRDRVLSHQLCDTCCYVQRNYTKRSQKCHHQFVQVTHYGQIDKYKSIL